METREASVDDMAAGIAEQLAALKEEQTMLVKERTTITDRLKWLAGEIDKAERMTKALIPRTRNTTTKPQPAVAEPVEQVGHKPGFAADGARS